MSRIAATPKLRITNLGPIREAEVAFGDLTVVIGPQASGKSVLLQTLKLLLDYRAIAAFLKAESYAWKGDPDTLLEAFFGEGMGSMWGAQTQVAWRGKEISKKSVVPGKIRSDAVPSLFYIPAHRVLAVSEGWPRRFGSFSAGDPFVVADFSEQLRQLMESGLGRGEGAIFPQAGRLTDATRKLLKRGIYGDFDLRLHQDSSGRRRLVLQQGDGKPLPVMVWSSGQREFSPLLLGLYHLLPSAGAAQRKNLDWVVLEEPEMGLHPRAITAVLFLVLELLHRGYRVCVSTHSPHVLDMMWALRVFIEGKAAPATLLKLFEVEPSQRNETIARDVLRKTLKVYYFDREGQVAVDISRLDPSSENPTESSWGGMTEFSSRASDVVADFVANQKPKRKRKRK